METNDNIAMNAEERAACPAPEPGGKPQAPARVVRELTLTDTVFAWLCLVLGYLVFRVFPASVNAMGAAVTQLLIYTVSAAVLLKRGFRPGAAAWSIYALAAALCVGLMLCGETVHRMLADWSLMLCFPFFVSVFCGRKRITRFLITDFLHAIFGVPGCLLKELFKALAARGNKGWRVAVRVLAGCALALIPVCIVFDELSYDSGFTTLMREIFTFDVEDVALILVRLLFGIPLAMLAFAVYLSATDGCSKPCRTPEKKAEGLEKVKRLPALTSCVTVLPVLFLYTVFVISQWRYYVSGFSGILPETETYAEYARSGFFELCRVAALNYALLLLIRIFQRQNTALERAAARVLAVLLGLFTGALLSTAMAKLILYIRAYALSVTRVYAAWFMAVLACAFLIGAVAAFTDKVRLVPATAAVAAALFAALCIANVPGRVADYNVDRYLSGDLATVDTLYLSDLGEAAVPAEVRLLQAWDKKNGTDWRSVKSGSYAVGGRDYSELVFSLRYSAGDLAADAGMDKLIRSTLPVIRARRAIAEAGILPWPGYEP